MSNDKFAFFLHALFIFIVFVSWSSCREVDTMSGGGGGSGGGTVTFNPDEVLRVCYDGWTENTATGECECLSPNVIVGQYECVSVESDDWYATMEGCLVDKGMIFTVRDVVHPDSTVVNNRTTAYFQMPDTIGRDPLIHRGTFRYLRRGERYDSVQFYMSSFAPLPYYKWFEYNTGFHGVIVNDSTMVGQFVFGPMWDSWELDRDLIFSECEAIIRKGRVE